MLLGEFEQRLDDKNRVTLPARLRERSPTGVVCSRGLDGCVGVWPSSSLGRATWTRSPSRLDPFTREGRGLQRYLFGAAQEGELDRQGRVALCGAAAGARGPRARTSSSPASATGWRSGTARPGAASSRRWKGARRLLPNALPTPAVSLTCRCSRARCASCSRCARATPSSTAPSARAAMPRLLAEDLDGDGPLRGDRPRPRTRAVPATPCADAGPGVELRGAARRRSRCACEPPGHRRRGRRRADGPRDLLDAGRPARARLLLRQDAPLDMRMDPPGRADRRQVVNE